MPLLSLTTTQLLSDSLRVAFARVETYCRRNSEAYHRQHDSNVAIDVMSAFEASPSEPVTVFHTRGYMGMPLADVALRLQGRLRCDEETLAVALVLCCRYASSKQPVTWHMLHRLYVAALHVAMKAHDDRFFTLAAFAKAAGVHKMEMPRLERAVVEGTRFRCVVLLTRDALLQAPTPLDAVVSLGMFELAHRAMSISASRPASVAADYADRSAADYLRHATASPGRVSVSDASPNASLVAAYPLPTDSIYRANGSCVSPVGGHPLPTGEQKTVASTP